MQAEENDASTYIWQGEIVRSWQLLEEDESGNLKTVDVREQRRRTDLNDAAGTLVKRGIIRFLVLVIDLSSSVTEVDFRPSRMAVTLNSSISFVREFFDQNPLSHLSIIVTRNGLAEQVTELSGNPNHHINMLKSRWEPGGSASLQNALELAHSYLHAIPSYGSREVVVLFNSMRTQDPGDIPLTIRRLVEARIHVSIVGVAAEVFVCSNIAKQTGGIYRISLDANHHHELLFSFASPPPQTEDDIQAPCIVSMGFPKRCSEINGSLCTCHSTFTNVGFQCPRCASKYCDLPVDCSVCGLTLVMSPHLARSYHHLFPVPIFAETTTNAASSATCFGCAAILDLGSHAYACPLCSCAFCLDCDIFIHESLHNCPGCQARKQMF
eukprot:ANDGO_01990.mRNA.1 General transcription factor IIH subunit 2